VSASLRPKPTGLSAQESGRYALSHIGMLLQLVKVQVIVDRYTIGIHFLADQTVTARRLINALSS
jgi:hypothetical protein